MLFVIKQENQDSNASVTAGMAQEGDAGLRLVLQGERWGVCGGQSALWVPVVGLDLG